MGGRLRGALALLVFGIGGALGCGGGNDADDGNSASPDYCDIEPILEAKCYRCHTSPPMHGAPFSLRGAQAFHEDYGDLKVYQAVDDAVSNDFMPPRGSGWTFDPPAEPLTAAEKRALLAFVRADAPLCAE